MASNNSSKTAHVMNLLSKNRGAAAEPPAEPKTETPPPAESAAPQPEAPAAQAAPAAPQVAPIISSINADAAVSSQIKDALEAELTGAETPAPQPPVRQEAPPRPEPARQPEAPAAEPVQPQAETPPPVQKERSAGSEAASYINVMQLLVDEKADEYMKMFGICCCEQCRVDVRAYALNHLPPKYVVLSENERIPRLTVYENRFSSDVTAQLIQACKKVMLTPHHSRADD